MNFFETPSTCLRSIATLQQQVPPPITRDCMVLVCDESAFRPCSQTLALSGSKWGDHTNIGQSSTSSRDKVVHPIVRLGRHSPSNHLPGKNTCLGRGSRPGEGLSLLLIDSGASLHVPRGKKYELEQPRMSVPEAIRRTRRDQRTDGETRIHTGICIEGVRQRRVYRGHQPYVNRTLDFLDPLRLLATQRRNDASSTLQRLRTYNHKVTGKRFPVMYYYLASVQESSERLRRWKRLVPIRVSSFYLGARSHPDS